MSSFIKFENLPPTERNEVIRLVDNGEFSDLATAIRICNAFGVFVDLKCDSCIPNHILIKQVVNENREG